MGCNSFCSYLYTAWEVLSVTQMEQKFQQGKSGKTNVESRQMLVSRFQTLTMVTLIFNGHILSIQFLKRKIIFHDCD